jgi:hypothetical protein
VIARRVSIEIRTTGAPAARPRAAAARPTTSENDHRVALRVMLAF